MEVWTALRGMELQENKMKHKKVISIQEIYLFRKNLQLKDVCCVLILDLNPLRGHRHYIFEFFNNIWLLRGREGPTECC